MQNQIGGMYPPQNTGISSPAVNPQANPLNGYKDIYYQLEQAIGADVQKVQYLAQKGVISTQQKDYLMAHLARKAQEINNIKNSTQGQMQNPMMQQAQQPQPQQMQPQMPTAPNTLPYQNPLDLFNQEKPGFFDGEGRADVLNYIKGYDMDKDEILRISQLVENLENSAVNKYLKKSDYERSLNDENAAAKSRLTSYAQNAAPDSFTNRIFTREDIGNMSGEEFTRNEKLITDQMKQGLIK